MNFDHPIFRLDDSGIIRVGRSDIPLDAILAAHRDAHSQDAILARFEGLTAEELRIVLENFGGIESDAEPRGPQFRDLRWQRWDAEISEELGNEPPPTDA